MPGSECRKGIANFLNEGLKNQESFGDVEGSENWKHIALPKIGIVAEQHIRQSACSFPKESDRFACYQNRFDKPHRSAGVTMPVPKSVSKCCLLFITRLKHLHLINTCL
jgi:hypothetical protein